MKNEDLKTGMILECRNGDLVMVLKDTANGDIVSGDNWQPIPINRNIIKDLNVTKIYQPQNNKSYLATDSGFEQRNISTKPTFLGLKDYEVIWSEDTKEMTVSQIEKELGYPIRIIEEEN